MIKNPHLPLLFNREKWYRFSDLQQNDQGEINAQFRVDPGSFWFSGHFPGNPILPGIAQLSMVLDAICRVKNERFQLEHVSRVRFKRIIRPDDPVEVVIRPDNRTPLAFTFQIKSGGELACSGKLRTAHPTKKNLENKA